MKRPPQKTFSLKQTSGSPFTIEDKISAVLLLEMLVRRLPLSRELGCIEMIEWQRSDWRPFDDILLCARRSLRRCLQSVPSIGFFSDEKAA